MSPNDSPTPAQLYMAQLLWLISAQLNALLGGGDFPVPDAQSVLGARPSLGTQALPDPPAAWPDKAALLDQLKGADP